MELSSPYNKYEYIFFDEDVKDVLEETMNEGQIKDGWTEFREILILFKVKTGIDFEKQINFSQYYNSVKGSLMVEVIERAGEFEGGIEKNTIILALQEYGLLMQVIEDVNAINTKAVMELLPSKDFAFPQAIPS